MLLMDKIGNLRMIVALRNGYINKGNLMLTDTCREDFEWLAKKVAQETKGLRVLIITPGGKAMKQAEEIISSELIGHRSLEIGIWPEHNLLYSDPQKIMSVIKEKASSSVEAVIVITNYNYATELNRHFSMLASETNQRPLSVHVPPCNGCILYLPNPEDENTYHALITPDEVIHANREHLKKPKATQAAS